MIFRGTVKAIHRASGILFEFVLNGWTKGRILTERYVRIFALTPMAQEVDPIHEGLVGGIILLMCGEPVPSPSELCSATLRDRRYFSSLLRRARECGYISGLKYRCGFHLTPAFYRALSEQLHCYLYEYHLNPQCSKNFVTLLRHVHYILECNPAWSVLLFIPSWRFHRKLQRRRKFIASAIAEKGCARIHPTNFVARNLQPTSTMTLRSPLNGTDSVDPSPIIYDRSTRNF